MRAFVTRVPFEDLAVQLGESGPLDPPAAGRADRCRRPRRLLLRGQHGPADPARVARLRGRAPRGDRRRAHGLRRRRADQPPGAGRAHAGRGRSSPRPGGARDRSSRCRCRRAATASARSSTARARRRRLVGRPARARLLARLSLRRPPRGLADFAPHHERLSTSPESGSSAPCSSSSPAADRIVTLRARTWFVDGPGRRERRVLADADAFAARAAPTSSGSTSTPSARSGSSGSGRGRSPSTRPTARPRRRDASRRGALAILAARWPSSRPPATSPAPRTSPTRATPSRSPSTTWRPPRASPARTSAASSGARSGSRPTPTCSRAGSSAPRPCCATPTAR